MIKDLRHWLCFLTCLVVAALPAQDIELYNSSWEDIPHAGKTGDKIVGWNDCGNFKETPPDIHQGNTWTNLIPGQFYPETFFDVDQTSSDGKTYLGMVVRENETWESVSQRLSTPMIGGRCYSFSIDLCKSPIYLSRMEHKKDELISFTTPIVLRIFGSNSKCGRSGPLAISDPIKNTDWQTYEFRFEPKEAYRYIILEAFYKTPAVDLYNGNILLDNASAIKMIDCDDGTLIADVSRSERSNISKNIVKKPKPKKEVNKPKSNPKPEVKLEESTNIADPVITSSSIIPELEDKVEVNQIIKIENLYFDENLAKIKKASHSSLDEVYSFLSENSKVVVEVSGHTNGLCAQDYCNKLSRKRARSVWLYLVHKGIPPQRIKYKGYGKQKPIADNTTVSGRQKNQRVEIKILSVDG